MYRKILVAFAASGLVATSSPLAHAQEPGRPGRVSPAGFWSANFSRVSLAPSEDDIKGRQWIGGGVSIERPFGQVWSLDARTFWNRRGARLPVPGSGGYRDVSTDYLTMPVLVKASHAGAVRPYLVGGAEIGVRLRARVRTVAGALDATEDAASDIRRIDVALNAGAGLERPLSASRVFVEALYAHGLLDVSADDAQGAMRTRTLTVLAGIRF